MSGGWAGSERSSELPSNWNQLKGLVHKRSGKRCEFYLTTSQRCPNPADGGVDHIVRGDNHRLSNLRDSCQTHHGKKSSAEGNEARAAKKAARKREPEVHPGRVQR